MLKYRAYKHVVNEVEMRERLNENQRNKKIPGKMSNKRYSGIRDPDEAPEDT